MSRIDPPDDSQIAKLDRAGDSFSDISAFMDWLVNERGVVLSAYVDGLLCPISIHSSKLVYEYFEIDPVELERERRTMLDSIRQGQAA